MEKCVEKLRKVFVCTRLMLAMRLTLLILVCLFMIFNVSFKRCFAEQKYIDPKTGLVIDDGFEIVVAYCVGCHTAKTVRVHRATPGGWKIIIRKMQGIGRWTFDPETERRILGYLSRNYPKKI